MHVLTETENEGLPELQHTYYMVDNPTMIDFGTRLQIEQKSSRKCKMWSCLEAQHLDVNKTSSLPASESGKIFRAEDKNIQNGEGEKWLV